MQPDRFRGRDTNISFGHQTARCTTMAKVPYAIKTVPQPPLGLACNVGNGKCPFANDKKCRLSMTLCWVLLGCLLLLCTGNSALMAGCIWIISDLFQNMAAVHRMWQPELRAFGIEVPHSEVSGDFRTPRIRGIHFKHKKMWHVDCETLISDSIQNVGCRGHDKCYNMRQLEGCHVTRTC